MAELKLDPKQRYLIQDGSGQIFIRTEKLAKRKDMREYDPKAGKQVIVPNESTGNLMEITLKDKSFRVEKALYDVLVEMGEAMNALQEENKALKEKCQSEPEAEKEKPKGKK